MSPTRFLCPVGVTIMLYLCTLRSCDTCIFSLTTCEVLRHTTIFADVVRYIIKHVRRISCHGKKITRILAANICRQFFFVINTAASTRCLAQNFQQICYLQRVNARSQYNDSGSSKCSKWPNDRMVAVGKHCWLLVQGKRRCRER